MKLWKKSGKKWQNLIRFFYGRVNLQLRIDLHVHTRYSYDSLIRPKELVFYSKKRRLDGVAITDHDTIEGVSEIAKETDIVIIPGIEVTSSEGHILGLNVHENIPKKLNSDETVDKIHAAGGIAIACHPAAFLKISLGKNMNSKFDAVEVINSSAFPFEYSVRHSQQIASRLGISQVAGSDAHYAPEIGYAYTVVDAELEVGSIMKAISKGLCKPFGEAIPLRMRLKREFLILKRKFQF